MPSSTPTPPSLSLQEIIARLEKQHGKGVLMTLAPQSNHSIPVLSSGSLRLNQALGVGGYPYGRIIEIYGPTSAGKTTLALHAMAEVQKKGGRAVLIDSEHAFDPHYASTLGVRIEEMLINQPDCGEQALEIAEQLIQMDAVQLVVIDSVAALLPRNELLGEISDQHIGGQARLMSKALRKLAGSISKKNAICIFINQLRQRIGVTFGNPEITPGGNALKYYASQRLEVRTAGQLKESSGEVRGHRVKVTIVKNKVAPPFRTTTFDLLYGKGIDHCSEIFEEGLEKGIFRQAGSWYSYGQEKIGQGKEAVLQWLQADADRMQALTQKLIKPTPA